MSCCKCNCNNTRRKTGLKKPLPDLVKANKHFWVSWGGVPECYTSLSDTAENVNGIYRFKALNLTTQVTVELFPYDLGLPGFNRDGRPCVVTQCLKDSATNGFKYLSWLACHKSGVGYSE